MIIADTTATTFCGPAGIDMLLRARQRATTNGTSLRLLRPSRTVLRVIEVLGADAVLPIYHSLEDTLAGP